MTPDAGTHLPMVPRRSLSPMPADLSTLPPSGALSLGAPSSWQEIKVVEFLLSSFNITWYHYQVENIMGKKICWPKLAEF